jgi:histidine triad (HIT) family protein
MPSIVARPWRAVSPSDCIFDEIASGARPAHLVLDEPCFVAFLDARPVFEGHALVIPREHVATLADLPVTRLGPLLEAGRRIAAAQRSALGADGTFFALNDIVSQSVPHVHLHVIPRRRGDGLRGFLWPRTRYESEAAAEAVAAQLRDALPQSELSPGVTS